MITQEKFQSIQKNTTRKKTHITGPIQILNHRHLQPFTNKKKAENSIGTQHFGRELWDHYMLIDEMRFTAGVRITFHWSLYGINQLRRVSCIG